jgi:glycosyltransferase involved in cell wall biosynthesis
MRASFAAIASSRSADSVTAMRLDASHGACKLMIAEEQEPSGREHGMTSQFASVRVVRAHAELAAQRSNPGADVSAEGRDAEQGGAVKSIYVAWVDYQRRAESMQRFFGYDLFYVSSKHLSAIYKLMSYVSRASATLRIVLKERPDVVWLQLPPTFLVHIVILLRMVVRRKMKIVADCHNAVMRAPWNGVPLSSLFLNKADLVLVHNHDVIPQAHRLGVDDGRLSVLGDSVPTLPVGEADRERQAKPTIVMPCSFHADEPIAAVLQAARQLESATFVITGNHRRIKNRALLDLVSQNVVFPGFLPLAEFNRLLQQASGVLCLTTHESIQLSAVSEAIAAGKPAIMSNTKVLRDLFGHGIFVDNSVGSILQGCRTAIERYDEYAAAARTMRAQRMQRWLEEAEPVRLKLAG